MADTDPLRTARPAGAFPSTHWSVVIKAGEGSAPDARAAFGRLYRTYQPALLAYLARRGRSPEEAADLVQSFFTHLLRDNGLHQVRQNDRFRCWLLGSFKHFLADDWDRRQAAKRGGGVPPESLWNEQTGQARDFPHPGPTPEEEYDRQYALEFLASVLRRLEEDYSGRDRLDVFRELQPCLVEKQPGGTYAELGRRLGMSSGRVSVEVDRLRKRYRKAFDERLAELVGNPADFEEERRTLFAALSR